LFVLRFPGFFAKLKITPKFANKIDTLFPIRGPKDSETKIIRDRLTDPKHARYFLTDSDNPQSFIDVGSLSRSKKWNGIPNDLIQSGETMVQQKTDQFFGNCNKNVEWPKEGEGTVFEFDQNHITKSANDWQQVRRNQENLKETIVRQSKTSQPINVQEILDK
jgi:hypothetical protein